MRKRSKFWGSEKVKKGFVWHVSAKEAKMKRQKGQNRYKKRGNLIEKHYFFYLLHVLL
jgi:hypothetical protein